MMAVILAAGNGERFRDAGYSTPKPLLPMPDGRPLIAWVRAGVPCDHQIIVMRSQDVETLAPHLEGATVCPIATPTCGPLVSAWAAAPMLSESDELLITYCDTVLPGGCADFLTAVRSVGAATAAVVFPSADPRYGYWDGAQVVEKEVISPWAVSGIFYFRRAETFLRRAPAYLDTSAGIPSLLDADTFCYRVDQVIDVGTPADYESFFSEVVV